MPLSAAAARPSVRISFDVGAAMVAGLWIYGRKHISAGPGDLLSRRGRVLAPISKCKQCRDLTLADHGLALKIGDDHINA